MKFIVFLMMILLLLSCQNQAELNNTERQRLISIGDSSANLLLKALVNSLKGALSSGGVVEGIEFCSKNAQIITENIERGLREGVEIKRATLKYRNKINKPDDYEKVALKYYQENWDNKNKINQPFIQYNEKTGKFRYYKPMGIKNICINCHGDQKQIKAEVRMRLKKYYKDDLATGYSLGEFRGVIRVSIPNMLVKK